MGGTGTSELELLVFDLEGRTFGLPSTEVVELVRAVAVTPLPNGPRVVAGVINLRGNVVPVFDLRVRFGISSPPLEPTDHFVVAKAGPRLVALRADRATEILQFSPDDIVAAERVVTGARHVAGIAKTAAGVVFVSDLDTFLSEAEAASLDDAIAEVARPG
jgi:purine-binding chemotaxis protein CheW